MTLVIGVVTPRGVVIGADGLATVGAAGLQVPNPKVFDIGACFACGISGDGHIDQIMVDALRASAIAQAGPATYTRAEATLAARTAIAQGFGAYAAPMVIAPQRPLSDLGSGVILFGGLCSDGPLLVSINNVGGYGQPQQPNFAAIGSGAETALLLLQAYSAFDFANHPLDTSVLLVKRVLDHAIAMIANLGGVIGLIAIADQPEPGTPHLRKIEPDSARVLDGLATWRLLETEMFRDLAAWAAPPAPAPAPAAGAPAADHAETGPAEPGPEQPPADQ